MGYTIKYICMSLIIQFYSPIDLTIIGNYVAHTTIRCNYIMNSLTQNIMLMYIFGVKGIYKSLNLPYTMHMFSNILNTCTRS